MLTELANVKIGVALCDMYDGFKYLAFDRPHKIIDHTRLRINRAEVMLRDAMWCAGVEKTLTNKILYVVDMESATDGLLVTAAYSYDATYFGTAKILITRKE